MIRNPNLNLSCLSSREDCLRAMLLNKKKKQFTYQQLADKIGRDKVWTAAALQGNAAFDEKEIITICSMLDINEKVEDFVCFLSDPPLRRPPEGFHGVCADPTIYRLYEITNVYGEALKALIHEECGDGIMSAIGLQVNFEVKKKDDGDHIVITLDGKFLPYKKW